MQARNDELLKGNYTVKYSNVNGILVSVDNTSQSWGLRWKFEFIYFVLWQTQIQTQTEARGLIWYHLNWEQIKVLPYWKAFPWGSLTEPSRAELPPLMCRQCWCFQGSLATKPLLVPQPNKLSIAMPPNCSSIQELDSMIHVDPFPTQNILCFCDTSPKTPSVSDLILSPTKHFLFLFFLLFALVFSLAFHAMLLHVPSRLIQLLLTFSCKYGFGLQPTHYTFKGCLIDKSLQINRKISCTLLFYFLLQRPAWTLSCAVPVLRPACSPWTFRGAVRLPCIDFYVP